MHTNRRLFILSAAAAAAVYSGPLTLLSADEAKFLEALVDQIIPADDAPGALQAGVVFYIDKQLAGPLKRFAATYRRSIPLFQSACREKTGRDFPALTFAERTEFLRFIEGRAKPGSAKPGSANPGSAKPGSAKPGSANPGSANPALASFFTMATEHAMQGFYGSPAHGGNADGASWKMLAIEDVMEGHVMEGHKH